MKTTEALIGNIYKDKRTHPTRMFIVTGTKAVKVGGVKTLRLYGITSSNEEPTPKEATFLAKDFDKAYPLLMWAPCPD